MRLEMISLTPEQELDLRAPFAPDETEFRVQSTFTDKKSGQPKAIVVAYIDARAVASRLDAVVGPLNWSFDWQPLVIEKGAVQVVKGMLTVCGVMKADVGDAGATEPTKSSVSDALKRAAVHWGIGRYLYELPVFFATSTERGTLSNEELHNLRGELRRLTAPAARAAQVAAQAGTQAGTQAVRAAAHEDALRLASAQEQQQLYVTLKRHFATVSAVENFLEGVLDQRPDDRRHIPAAAVRESTSDLTVGEIAQILAELRNHPPLTPATPSREETRA